MKEFILGALTASLVLSSTFSLYHWRSEKSESAHLKARLSYACTIDNAAYSGIAEGRINIQGTSVTCTVFPYDGERAAFRFY